MKLFIFVALIAFLSGSVAHCQCVGFVNKGDVFVNCEGRESRITHRGTVEQFAVAPDTSALVLQHRQRSGRRVEIVSVKDGSSVWRPSRGTFDVTQSCGTVVGRESVKDGFQVRDVLTDQLLTKSPYREFACSGDSKTIVGVTDSPAHLRIGTPPDHDLANVEHDNLVQFSISREGQYVAYVTDIPKIELCTSSISATNSRCVEVGVFPVQGLSVNDEGSVLFSTGDDACAYGERSHGVADSCSNVFKWTAGQAEPGQLMSGAFPVWLTKSQEFALVQLKSKVTRSKTPSSKSQ